MNIFAPGCRRAVLAVLAASLAGGCATSRAPAPVDDRRPSAAAKPATLPVQSAAVSPVGRPGTYVVKRGDTLYSIALEHGADYRDVAQWNNLDDPSKIRIGQELRVTPPAQAAGTAAAPGVQVGSARARNEVESHPIGATPASPAAPAAAAAGGLKTEPKALRLPYSEQNLALLQRGDTPAKPAAAAPAPAPAATPAAATPASTAPAAASAATAATERAADAIDFIWPAKGRVVAGFLEPRSKGLDIAGNLGDPVYAAAAGRVIYVGSGIPGLGKFIVVRHENGFNTVYAHNRENLVKMDQNIARGQKIAEMGASDAESPRLHFQIRRQGTPLDPAKYLPAQ